ncbi:pyrroloquinoline quinone biosynthesis protein PqqB [Pseudoroseomonas globiformis]|uniref:Coenzyme PQQ synthesis protein B n=1 Tax=Teichococcus globiformis TaxID=2307229 RepID=A0ABV7FUE8_9PROT
MRAIVLGSAAGGGFPQWNCACAQCDAVRRGDARFRRRTQFSLAVSWGDGDWLLINAAPEILQQIADTPALHPRTPPRHSPVAAVMLTGGEIDAVAGLLSLRERQPFLLRAAPAVMAELEANPIFTALSAVERQPLGPGEAWTLPDGGVLRAFAVPGKVPLYRETADDKLAGDHTLAIEISAPNGTRACIVPGCQEVTPALRNRLEGAALLLYDGTVWTDNEMSAAGVGSKTGRRMGHQPLSGADGALAALAGLNIGRRVLVHINNTNPLLDSRSAARREAEALGWEVAEDGMELTW